MSDTEKKERQQEAIKVLAEWSKWLVTLQPAAIVAIGALIKLGPEEPLSFAAKVWVITSLLFFVLSIVAASFVLGALPTMVERLPSSASDEKGVYDMSVYFIFRLWHLILAEHAFFVLGILSFSVFLCLVIVKK
jgi:hypothetical protein